MLRSFKPLVLLACLVAALPLPRAGAAFRFDGQSALQLPAVPDLGDYTVACRFSPAAGSLGVGRTIFASDDNAGASRNLAVFQPDGGFGDGTTSCWARVDGVGPNVSTAPPSEGTLHTIVIRRTGTNVSWWLDGVRIAMNTAAPNAFTLATPTVGAYFVPGTGYFAFFEGLIDRFSLWSRTWTAAEIAAFHANPDIKALADRSGLVYDLPLDTDTVERHSGAAVTVQGTPTLSTGTLPPPATPPPPPAAVARIRAGWPKLSPDRELLSFLIETVADGADARIALEFGGATLTVDGGTPIPLTDPLYSGSTSSHLISYPLGHAPEIAIVDDAGATPTGTGWSTAPPGSGLYGRYAAGVSSSPVPGDTRLYSFTGLTPGTYSLAVDPASNAADATADASYSCDDGVLAPRVLHQDQTAPNLSVEDFLEAAVYWQTLGTVTVSGTTAAITLANAAGSGTLWADGIRLEKVSAPVIPGNATTITFDAPDGWASVAAGDVAGASGRAVSVAAADEWFGYDPDLPHPASGPLEIGRNHNGIHAYTGCRLRANMLLACNGPAGIGGDVVKDADGNVTGLGTATGIRWRFVDQDGMKDGLSDRGLNPLRAGTWKVRYHGTASTPAPVMVDANNAGLFSVAYADGGIDAASGKTVKLITVTMSDYLYRYPILTELQFPGIPSDADIPTGLELFDPDTPADWSRTVHPLIYGREHGPTTGISTLRFLDTIGTNGIGTVDWADFPPEGWNAFMTTYRTLTATVAAIEPVDTSAADLDRARALFGNRSNKAVFKVTTTAPHGFRSNHYVAFSLAANNPRDNAGGTIETTGPWVDFIHVLSPTEFLALRSTNSSGQDNPNQTVYPDADDPPLTLAAGLAPDWFGSGTVRVAFGQALSPVVCARIANDLEVIPWLNIPHTMSDQAIDDYADAVLAVLDPGRKVRLEYSNEPWNTQVAPYHWLEVMAYRTGKATGGGDYFNTEYTLRAAAAHARFRARWAAAGRDPNDVIRVMGSQSAGPDKTRNILDVCKARGLMFEELCLDTYVGANAPLDIGQPGYAADPTPAFDRLGVAGIVSLMGMNQRYTDWGSWIGWHRDLLDDAANYPGFSGVKLVSYEGGYQQLCPHGSDVARSRVRGQAASRHPSLLSCYKARLQMLEGRGFTLYCHYVDDGNNKIDEGRTWVARPVYSMDDGKGDGSDGKFDNRKGYFAYDRTVSVQGQAEAEYAALSLKPKPQPVPMPQPTPVPVPAPTPPPTPVPTPTPAPVPAPTPPPQPQPQPAGSYSVVTASLGTVGVAQTVTITLDRPGDATVTLRSPDGMFTAFSVKFAASAGPQIVHFVPVRPGTVTIATTNDAGLADPEPVEVEVVRHLAPGKNRGNGKAKAGTPGL